MEKRNLVIKDKVLNIVIKGWIFDLSIYDYVVNHKADELFNDFFAANSDLDKNKFYWDITK